MIHNMAFTPDEEKRVSHMEQVIEDMARKMGTIESQNTSMYNVIVGEPKYFQIGLAERVTNLERTSDRIEKKVDEIESQAAKFKKSWRSIGIAIAIGFLLGALAFGLITWSQFVEATKEGVKIVK